MQTYFFWAYLEKYLEVYWFVPLHENNVTCLL